ncbi:MAG: hypothetical protein WC784_03490 [Candidatus Shapirobacteria bacterium]
MEKTINKIGRICFWGILGVMLVGIAVGECIYLSNYQNNNVLVTANLNNKEFLTVAAEAMESGNLAVVQGQVTEADARPIIIEKYLAKYNSPLLPYAREIFDLSQSYGFDYYWMVAIAQQESNLCKKIPDDSNNCWGYGINSAGTLRFDNYDLALKAYAAYLKTQYFDKGLNTPELIMKKYCPHSDGSWARGVRQFIDEMESGNF